MPYYDPKSQLGKGPQAWNPDWGLASEMMGTFERPSQQDPDRFKQPAAPHMPLSAHMQMFGGMVTDPDTGEQFYVKLNAPPEPQGNQSWHLGIIDGEWTDHPLARHNNNYFSKMETPSWHKQEDLGNVAIHTLQQNGFIENPITMRAQYAGGPPTIKQSFPGLRELPAAFGSEYNGFHKRRQIVTPAPLLGKALRPANYAGRITAPIGAQRVRAAPHESIQYSKGKASGGSNLNTFGHRVGGMPHSGNVLIDNMRTSNERHLNVENSSESLNQVRNATSAGQFDPTPTQHQQTSLASQVAGGHRRPKNQTYSLDQVRPTAQNSTLQHIAASRDHAPSYSIRRDHALAPSFRVSLMRFGRPAFNPRHFAPKDRAHVPGSTRLDSQGTDPDYTSMNSMETVTTVTGAHPMESLRFNDTAPASGVIHMVSGFAGAPAASETNHAQEDVGEYTVEGPVYTQPETSVRQEFYTTAYHAQEEVDTTSIYAVYEVSRNPETSLRMAFPPRLGDYNNEPSLFKDHVVTTNPETSVRQEFGPQLGDYQNDPELFKDHAITTNPETSVRREFGPHLGDYQSKPGLFKDYAVTTNPETSVRREFGPHLGDYQNKPQLHIPSAANQAKGRSMTSAPMYESAMPAPAMVRRQHASRTPHGVFTGQLTDPHKITQVTKSAVWKDIQTTVAADDMARRTITQTLTNAGIRVNQSTDPTPYMLYDQNPRTQMYFPPVPTTQ
jgi:hypothetical protein